MNTMFESERDFLKDNVRKSIDFSQTDQQKGVPPPPVEKPFPPEGKRIPLTADPHWTSLGKVDLATAIRQRRSHRLFSAKPMTLEELAFLLWATQGVRERLNTATALRTVPSAGARHAFETYLCVLNVESLAKGLYRYLPVEHQLLLEREDLQVADGIVAATLGQSFTGQAAVHFIWTTIPYRMEWRYNGAAHKVIALDAGHVCQNLYLASEAVGAGACAMAAYDQDLMDELVRVDGKDEFVVYLAAVGKKT
jgi:SagB-type dehydrogenase family enzyme